MLRFSEEQQEMEQHNFSLATELQVNLANNLTFKTIYDFNI